MQVAVPKEILPGENRVALIPHTIASLTEAGLEVLVESGAGTGAFIADEAYAEAGAQILPNADALYAAADIVFKVRPPEASEVEK
jgi:NAD(P) transhydrogenase subunit alpha